MADTSNGIQTTIRSLAGLKLSIARNAGNMKVLHFGKVRHTAKGLVGQFAIHIQCPWRLERRGQMVTGWGDYYVRADDNEAEDWEPGSVNGHIQNQILGGLLGGYDSETRTHTNETDNLVVEVVSSDSLGGLRIYMSGEYELVLFPCASRGEAWRLFEPGCDRPHLVFEAGAARLE